MIIAKDFNIDYKSINPSAMNMMQSNVIKFIIFSNTYMRFRIHLLFLYIVPIEHSLFFSHKDKPLENMQLTILHCICV